MENPFPAGVPSTARGSQDTLGEPPAPRQEQRSLLSIGVCSELGLDAAAVFYHGAQEGGSALGPGILCSQDVLGRTKAGQRHSHCLLGDTAGHRGVNAQPRSQGTLVSSNQGGKQPQTYSKRHINPQNQREHKAEGGHGENDEPKWDRDTENPNSCHTSIRTGSVFDPQAT